MFSCDGCHKKGRGLLYHCTEGCNWDLHVDCAGDYVAYDAEQKQLRVSELRTAFASVRSMGKLMGLSEKDIQEVEFEGQSLPEGIKLPTDAEMEAVATGLADGMTAATQECAQQ